MAEGGASLSKDLTDPCGKGRTQHEASGHMHGNKTSREASEVEITGLDNKAPRERQVQNCVDFHPVG